MKYIKNHKEVREEIISVASKIFSRFGLKKTRFEEIALASKKAKSSLYFYFRNKEEIYAAVIEKEAKQLRTELIKNIQDIKDPSEKLRIYILLRIQKLREVNNYYSSLKNEYLSNFQFIEKIREDHDKKEIEIIENILKEGVKKGIFEVKDSKLAASSIVTAMKSFELNLIISEEDPDRINNINKVINFLLYGIIRR